MRLFPPASLLVSVLLVSSTIAAQTPPQRDPQAVAILQASVAALGGTRVGLPGSVTGSGTYTQFQAGSAPAFPLRFKVLGTDKFRWETDSPDGTVTVVVRGDLAEHQRATNTQRLPVTQLLGKTAENFPILAIARWIGTPTIGLQLVGSEIFNGRSVYHISILKTWGGVRPADFKKAYEQTNRCELFVDQQTYMPVGVRYYEHPTDWRVSIPVDLVFSDFRPVGGLQFPFTLTRYRRDYKLSIVQLQFIQLNPLLADQDFMVR